MDAASNRASQARRNGGNFGRTYSVESLSTRYLPELRLSRVKHNASAKGPGNGKAEALPVFSISGGAFSDLRKRHLAKIRKSTKWPTGGGAFSDQGERKLPGASVSNAFPESATSARQLPALASLACRIGLQRGESGTEAECIHVGIWDAPQQGLHLNAPA